MSKAENHRRPADPGDEPEWPNTIRTRAELDAALEEGVAGGRVKESILDVVAKLKARQPDG